jgi:hypothetical protein
VEEALAPERGPEWEAALEPERVSERELEPDQEQARELDREQARGRDPETDPTGSPKLAL